MADEVVNGTDVLVFMSPSTGTAHWHAVAHATTHTFSKKMATRETSNKGTGDFVTRAAGRLDISVSVSGMVIFADSQGDNLEQLMIAQSLRVPVMLILAKETVAGNRTPDTTTSGGAHFYGSGQFFITSCDADFPDQANSTYSASFEHAEGWDENHLVVS
jgi:predicted secreted protein